MIRRTISPLLLAAALAGITQAQFGAPTPATPSRVTPTIADCIFPPDPVPTGQTVTPSSALDPAEYAFMHSATHLQGEPAREKFAPGLFYNPTAMPFFSGFSSAVIVNNISETNWLSFVIDYYDQAGNPVGSSGPHLIAPNATHYEGATPLSNPVSTTPGLGSARIWSDEEFVGATLHHVGYIYDFYDPDPFMPGAASMQQLQVADYDASELWWGPLPYTTTSSKDFFNGNSPFYFVVNPNPVPNTIRIDYTTNNGAVVVGTPFVLPPYGSFMDTYPFFTFINWYLQGLVGDFDLEVHVVSEDGLPILGEGVMTDFFGPGLVPGARWRMGSTMMATMRQKQLINPELTFEAGGFVETLMGVYNAGSSNTGKMEIQYFDRTGTIIGTDTFPAGLNPLQSIRVGNGLAQTPNYPSSTTWDGWARIRACEPRAELVGWTMREIGANDDIWPSDYQFYKVYGELLEAGGGMEPGTGFPITDMYGTFTRKVAPLTRTDPWWYWPGYFNLLNDAVSNVGPYLFRLFDAPSGIDVTSYAGQPFAGVAWGATSQTYEDPQSTATGNSSGRVDVTNGPIKGIDAIGDPLVEYLIPDFPSY